MTNEEVMKLLANQQNARARSLVVVDISKTAAARREGLAATASLSEMLTGAPFEWSYSELPPSTNKLVRPAVMGYHFSAKGKKVPTIRFVKTQEAEEWLEGAVDSLQLRAIELGHVTWRGVPLKFEITVVVDSISSDGTNRIKALEDACKGIVWSDDCQVVDARVIKRLRADAGEDEPAFTLRVWPCGAEEHLTYRLRHSKTANGGNDDV